MKKLSLIIILFSFIFSSAYAEGIRVKAGKTSYLRYELVDLYCDYTPEMKKSFLNLNNTPTLKDPATAVVTARIFSNNRQIRTVGSTDEITLKYDRAKKNWAGLWPIPWNPRLGSYKAVIIFNTGSKKFAGNVGFDIKKRTPKPLPKGFCVMDILNNNARSRHRRQVRKDLGKLRPVGQVHGRVGLMAQCRPVADMELI